MLLYWLQPFIAWVYSNCWAWSVIISPAAWLTDNMWHFNISANRCSDEYMSSVTYHTDISITSLWHHMFVTWLSCWKVRAWWASDCSSSLCFNMLDTWGRAGGKMIFSELNWVLCLNLIRQQAQLCDKRKTKKCNLNKRNVATYRKVLTNPFCRNMLLSWWLGFSFLTLEIKVWQKWIEQGSLMISLRRFTINLDSVDLLFW